MWGGIRNSLLLVEIKVTVTVYNYKPLEVKLNIARVVDRRYPRKSGPT